MNDIEPIATQESDLIIARLEGARNLLAQARDASDAKQVADVARAAQVYARRQKLSRESILAATTLEVDAMTSMGEFLQEAPKNDGAKGNPGGQGASVVRFPDGTAQVPTLASIGIGKKESSNAQALASLQKEAPEVHDQVRTGKLTVSAGAARARRIKVEQQKMRTLESAPPASGQPAWDVITADCLEGLASLPPASARLLFADPPYNVGIDYGEGGKADLLPEQDYLRWAEQWVALARDTLTADGSLWLLIDDEHAAEHALILKRAGLTIRSWIKWYETFGVNCTNKFNRTSRHLFYAVKDPRQFVFNADAPEIRRASDRQEKYDDARANPAGKLLDDVWIIPRLTGTCAERIPGFPTQLPIALLRRVVACASNPGDLVVDPFNGSGTTGAAALGQGRRYQGFEKSPTFAELARKRLRAVQPEIAPGGSNHVDTHET